MKPHSACPSCGAMLATGADRCDLCGTSVNDYTDPGDAEETGDFSEELIVSEPTPSRPASPSIEPVTCGTCGRTNPAQSRFCNQCGTFLDGVSSPPVAKYAEATIPVTPFVPEPASGGESAERPPSDVGRRALWMVGAGVIAVLVLYFITQASGGDLPAAPPTAEEAQVASPVGPGALPDSLQALVSALEAEGTAASWARIGHLYFTAAMRVDETARAELAGRAVDAFDLSVEIEENPDIRTSLAEAAQFDPRNPMRAVIELQAVLETTPDHIAANYLLGALRARIGRFPEAAESFQLVIDLSPITDPIHERAVQDLAAVRQSMASGPASP